MEIIEKITTTEIMLQQKKKKNQKTKFVGGLGVGILIYGNMLT